MLTSPVADSKNSTTVRSPAHAQRRLPFAIRAVGAGLRVVEAGSPALAAQLGMEVMFRTQRSAPAARERALLERGERFTVDSAPGPLAVWSFGAGPTVILMHGWNGRGGQLDRFVEPLVQRGFRVVTFDAPGHGQSPGHTSSLLDFADAVDAVLDAVGLPFVPVHAVIAHSMGGAAVTYAMSRYARAPEVGRARAWRDGLPVRRFAFLAPPIDVGDFVASFIRMNGLGPSTQDALRRRIEARFAMSLDALYAPPLAREMTAPLLVVHDEEDRDVPVRCGRLLAEAWPGAELEITRGLGHMRVLRDAAVIDRVVSFVAT